jgi:hypothetical protein
VVQLSSWSTSFNLFTYDHPLTGLCAGGGGGGGGSGCNGNTGTGGGGAQGIGILYWVI